MSKLRADLSLVLINLFGFDNKSLKSIENSLANNFARIFKRGKSCAGIILSQHLGLSSRNLDQSGRFFKIKNSWKRFFKIYQIPWFSQAVIEIIYKSFFFQTFIFHFFHWFFHLHKQVDKWFYFIVKDSLLFLFSALVFGVEFQMFTWKELKKNYKKRKKIEGKKS